MGLGVGQSSCHHRTEVAWLRLVFPVAAVLGLLIGEHLRANSCVSWINTGDRGRGREGKEVKREKLRMLKRRERVTVADQGGFLGFRGTPFLSFCAHASPASCARMSAVDNVLDSGTPPFATGVRRSKERKGTYAAERKRRERARR